MNRINKKNNNKDSNIVDNNKTHRGIIIVVAL